MNITTLEKPAMNLGDAVKTRDEAALPGHLIQLPGSEWVLWRYVGLRGAGFPAEHLLKISSAECASAADELLMAEQEMKLVQGEALKAINAELDALRSNGKWDDTNLRDPLLKAIRVLKKGKSPDPLSVGSARPAIEAFQIASSRAVEMLARFREKFKEGVPKLSQVIQEAIEIEGLSEAIIWQNRQAFHTGIGALLRKKGGGEARGSKQRQYEEMVASYLQRYCAKNDTIGFFGPVGWANFVSQGEAITTKPGPNLVAERTVYFESWCIDKIAEKVSVNESIRPWLAPRRVPYIYLEGATLYQPAVRPFRLPPKHAVILHACDGIRTAKQIALEMIRNPSYGVRNEADVYAVLDQLKKQGLISWTIDLHVDAHPDKILRRLLERVEPDNLREPALEVLDELVSARDAVAVASGDSLKLDQALGNLEEIFTRLTSVAATRGAGETYAGRTLVYEDCRRDIEIDIGPDILESLGPPLSLILTSARWITVQLAELYREAFTQIYLELVRQTGSSTVDAVSFWVKSLPLFLGEEPKPADLIEPLLQERWARILSIDPSQRRVNYTCDELRPRVMAEFDTPRPSWSFARYHSPDIMIAASSTEAIQRGEYQLVMGELHIALNTLGASLFVEQHPAKENLRQAVESDFPQPRLAAIPPKSWPNAALRTRHTFVTTKDFRVALSHDSISDPELRPTPVAALVIENTPKGLMVRTRDGRKRFDIVEAMGDTLATLAINSLKILSREKHMPRVTIDRLIICRESWSMPATEMQFAYEKDEADRFLAARRWAQEHAIPRFVFVKAPVEKKPFYLDFDSLSYVNIFAKVIRRSREHGSPDGLVTLTEMIPRTDETWLPDAEGRLYTSELRIVAVDR